MSATKAPTRPEIGVAQRRLDVFVGKWHTEGTWFADGQRPDDPRASGVPWASDEHYERLPGGFFLLHQWDALAGTREFKTPRSLVMTKRPADTSPGSLTTMVRPESASVSRHSRRTTSTTRCDTSPTSSAHAHE